MDDSQKKFLRLPIKSVGELLELLEEEQAIGWHGVSDPPPPPVVRPQYSILLEELIHIIEDFIAIQDYEMNGVSEEAKEESW
jgi:hypothetical protein